MRVKAPMYRQGDVLLVPVAELPADAKPQARDQGRIVLAYGEVTGHAHAIVDAGAQLFEHQWEGPAISFPRREAFLRLVKPAALRHEEHAPIVLEPGTYRYVTSVEQPVGGSRVVVATDSFTT